MTNLALSSNFGEHTRSLMAFAYHLTKDRNDAEDLYQDTMYKALRYQHQYQPKTNLLAWLMTIMRNTFINDWRKRRRAQQAGNMEIPGVTLAQKSVVRNGGESQMTVGEITHALQHLDEGLRKPFLMAFRGYKYEEIAQEMELPLGTIKSRIHQARKVLRRQLSAWYRTQRLSEILD
ncbi:MAG: RNA polymerase sigma factor [Bacteroidetes bacterium]|nr:MAG: RNA polymerase sigma factor [Bacteroidota bacterium]